MAEAVHSEQLRGPMPGGGAYAIAYWRDADGAPTTKDRAVAVEVIEFDADDRAIQRTYARLSRSKGDIFI